MVGASGSRSPFDSIRYKRFPTRYCAQSPRRCVHSQHSFLFGLFRPVQISRGIKEGTSPHCSVLLFYPDEETLTVWGCAGRVRTSRRG